MAAALVQGTLLAAYRFDTFKPDAKRPAPELEALMLSGAAIRRSVARAALVTAAQNRARDLGNRPANELTPPALADYATALDGHDGISVEGDGRGRDPGARAWGRLSPSPRARPRARGSSSCATTGRTPVQMPLLALVGKAVTFDSGGLSLKPAATMHEMKFDMCGGAAVIEAIAALAALRAPVRVLGIVGATENLPGSTAVKPGDIVTALDGTTIEVNNTDAEGRLVLADCLTYARRLGAERIVDLATLTGAIVTALGSTYAGLMANDDAWAEAVRAAGERSGELLWRLPLHERYAEMVRGRYADITNRTERREAAAITAAEFLHHFVAEVPWAHLDIAAVPTTSRAPTSTRAPAASECNCWSSSGSALGRTGGCCGRATPGRPAGRAGARAADGGRSPCVSALAGGGASARRAGAGTPPPPTSAARLGARSCSRGRHERRTVAGEHTGEGVHRTWVFTPACAGGRAARSRSCAGAPGAATG